MNVINQTNRTLLLEEINPEKLDLLTLIGDVKGFDSLSDDKVKEINRELACKSYDEFEEKFAPCVYSFFDANTQSVKYTLKKPETIADDMLTEIPITTKNDFLKMLFTIIDSKKAQGVLNSDFGFEKLLDMISPKKVMEDIKQTRKEMRYNYSKYAEMDDNDPAKLDIGDKLNVLFEEASSNYNNVMAMLPLAIEDIKTRLLLGAGEDSKDNTPLALGMLSMGENGELKVLEAPKSESTALALVDDKVNTGLVLAIEEDYTAINESGASDYVKALVTRTFCPLVSTTETTIDVSTEVANYNNYLTFYKESKDAFIKVVKPLVETLLGVKMFFEQYKVRTKGMQPVLLVANIKPEMLAKSSNIPTLIAYLNTVNNKNNFENTLWYAIYPNLSISTSAGAKISRTRFAGNVHKENINTNSLETLSILLNVLKDYRVETFFSFETREETTFNIIASEGVEKYMERCAPLTGKDFSEFALPCLPNFTVIPKNKSGVTLDNKMVLNENEMAELSKEKEDIMKLWIEGVYISATYVAAGFKAACQCPEFLKDRFKKQPVNRELPGVRYDVETANNSLHTLTSMPKEITGFTNVIKNQINARNFGFVFASENASLDGKNITDISVYKARNLMYDTEKSTYEQSYKTQVTTYIERILRHATNDFKEDNIKIFFSNNPKSQKSQWLASKEAVNAILGGGDDINFEINDMTGRCELSIFFDGNARNLEVEISRVSSK
ncbi:MAG: transcriptional regulator [Eubacteriales bacterium]